MNQSVVIQDLAIVIAARNFNQKILTTDFLKYSGIIPPDGENIGFVRPGAV